MSGPSAKVIADSIDYLGRRVTSVEGVLHRPVLAELNTHRLISRPEADAPLELEEFSRNSASSRAIPVQKQLDRVHNDPAIPVSWPAEKKGMQGGAELTGEDLRQAQTAWMQARHNSMIAVTAQQQAGLHKSVTNRLIEPYMWHTVILTATNWQGFFDQRCDENAQPEIRVFAEAVKAAYDASTPVELHPKHWHLPYIDDEDVESVEKYVYDLGESSRYNVTRTLVQVSTTRCARTSYMTHDGKRDVSEDLGLYDRLVTARPVHFSPAEHPCRSEPGNVDEVVIRPDFGQPEYTYVGPRYGNFTGYHQHRFDLMGVR